MYRRTDPVGRKTREDRFGARRFVVALSVAVLCVLTVGGCSGCKKKRPPKPPLGHEEQFRNLMNELDMEARAAGLINLAGRQVKAMSLDAATKSFKEAANAIDNINYDSKIRATLRVSLAEALYRANRKSEARSAFSKAKKTARKIKNPVDRAPVYVRLAAFERTRNNHNEAVDFLKTAEILTGKFGDNPEIKALAVQQLFEIAEGYAELKESKQVERMLRAMEKTALSAGEISLKCQNLLKVVEAQYELRQMAAAKANLKKAEELADGIEDPLQKASRLVDVGNTCAGLAAKFKDAEMKSKAWSLISKIDTLTRPLMHLGEYSPVREDLGRLEDKLKRQQ